MKSRRAFLRDSGLAAGGLWVAVHLPGCAHPQRGGPADFAPNAFLRVTPDDRVIFTLARVEMGQGTLTSEAMLVCEELGLPLAQLEIEHAPNDTAYKNPDYDIQTTGGSNSTKSSWGPLRQAGATVREALLGAAAAELGVPRTALQLDGKVVRGPEGKSVRIGALAVRARGFVDTKARLKEPSEWTLIGRPQRRLDARSKSDGTALFGADVDLPGLEVAVVLHGPIGAKLERFDAAKALQSPGVKAVFPIEGGLAVVADRYWRARRAAGLVEVIWSASTVDTDEILAGYRKLLSENSGSKARSEGDAEAALSRSKSVITSDYRLPYLAHAAMEPMTATAHVTKVGCDIWAPTQSTTLCATLASQITGLSKSDIRVHQTILGGGFGRKNYGDVVAEAVQISQRRGAPVRVQWSREDDLQNDYYRPASVHRLRAAVEGGKPVAWSHHLAAQSSVLTESVKGLAAEMVPAFLTGPVLWSMRNFTVDDSVVEGARELPYQIDNLEVRYHVAEAPVPAGIWRSVGHSFNGFVTESFFDEVAAAAGRDPLELRLALLGDHHPHHRAVLELAAAKAGWSTPAPEGRARGLAVHEAFGSFCAVVAEVSLEDGRPRVHKLTAAADCGLVVNPDGVVAQVEGGLLFGLSAAVEQQEITVKAGRVQQSNFHDFGVLRMFQSPAIEVHLVQGTGTPRGIGEVAVPPAAPAVANALARLTGKRIRSLPIDLAKA